jgi:hypothetical protein
MCADAKSQTIATIMSEERHFDLARETALKDEDVPARSAPSVLNQVIYVVEHNHLNFSLL